MELLKNASEKQRFTITIEGHGVSYNCPEDENILRAMVDLGKRGIPSGCHGGGCGICKVRILSGKVRTKRMSRDHVSEEEERDGYVLACKAFPLSPLRIEVIKLTKAMGRRYGFV